MKGDFTRNTFDPGKHFRRVLMQQGRVQLDADWNEQAAILLHYLQSMAVDLIGPYAGPQGKVGFEIKIPPGGDGRKDFEIHPGRYYVNGILCENENQINYLGQADFPVTPGALETPYLVYLDVWERHLTYIQEPEIREVALGGPDTATRAKIVWQVKVEHRGPNDPNATSCPNDEAWTKLVNQWQSQNRGMLKAGTKEFEVDESTEPCTVPPESKYRGAENQLYRVEIHRGGEAWDGKMDDNGNPEGNAKNAATFKWSRENGSVVFPILKMSTAKDTKGNKETMEVTLEHLGRDERFSLHEGDWVEIVDDGITLRGEANPLLQVKSIDHDRLVVTLESQTNDSLPTSYDENSTLHPLLRRWDHKGLDPTLGYPKMADNGALALEEDNWLLLEDGIQICFEPGTSNNPNTYRTGDYWLIPARTATGDVEWPGPRNAPESRPPLGVYHSYAPLAIISTTPDGSIGVTEDCRREIKQLWTSPPSG